MNKDETWDVEEGEFIYRWIDTEIGQINEDQLSEGDVVRQTWTTTSNNSIN